MEYPIDYRGRQVGTLTVTRDGLYWQLSAWTEPFAEGVQRLFGCDPDGAVCFGVFAPSGRELSLHRRLSVHAFPTLPNLWTAGRTVDGFLPWRGTVEGQTVVDAMRKPLPDGALLALAADRDPIPLAEYAPQMQTRTLDGRAYFCLRLSGGVPSLPAEASEPETEVPASPETDLPASLETEATAAEASVEDLIVREEDQTSSTSSTGQ